MITHSQIFSLVWPFALSLATTFVSQMVSTSLVSPIGSVALATLAVASAASSLPLGLTVGLITSVQQKVAVAVDSVSKTQALSAGLVLSCVIMMPISMLYFAFSPSIARFLTLDDAVSQVSTFLRIQTLSFLFSAFNQAFFGYWMGEFKSKVRLWVVMATTSITILGNLLLIPILGIQGVAWSLVLSTVIGFIINLTLVLVQGWRFSWPSRKVLKHDAFFLGGVSFHQLSLLLSMNAVVYIVGRIGIQAQAVASVIGTLSLPALFLGFSYGTASGSLLSKASQLNDRVEVKNVGHKILKQALFLSLVMAFGLMVSSHWIRAWFFHDPIAYRLASGPFITLAFLVPVDVLCLALQRFHFVSGGVRSSAWVMTIVQWGIFMPAAYLGVEYADLAYTQFVWMHLAQRAIITSVLYLMWLKRLESSDPIR